MGEERLGPYRLLSPLGSGGFGEVHLALNAEGHTVAVKVLHPHVASDAVALTRLGREVDTMRRVRGPHVAEILDACLAGARPYVVTRYVQGKTLSAVGVLDGDDLLRVARGLARALVTIHEAGVVHRDLKPNNVIVADGEPYVIDFGIAVGLDVPSVTATGAVVGTPGYLAPEVLEGRDAGPPADVFAWAATVAFVATGRQPYGTGPAPAVAYRVVHGRPDLEGVPSWLEPLLRECLARDPASRPDAERLAARLGAIVPAPARKRRRRRSEETTSGLAVATREWSPGAPPRSSTSVARERYRDKVRRRWIVGSGLVVGLLAATGREYVPEASLLLMVVYGLGVLVDAGFALAAKERHRMVVDLAAIVGVVVLWGALSSMFSTFVLLMAVGLVLFGVGLLVLAS